MRTDLALKPEALDRAERRIRQLVSERRLLVRMAGLDGNAAAELAALDAELEELRAAAKKMADSLEEEAEEGEAVRQLQV